MLSLAVGVLATVSRIDLSLGSFPLPRAPLPGLCSCRGRFSYTMLLPCHWRGRWRALADQLQALPGAGFIVNGATLAQNSALASAGGELRLANGITLLAKFDGEFASHSSSYGGSGTFRYRW